jgi:hypothetical protein
MFSAEAGLQSTFSGEVILVFGSKFRDQHTMACISSASLE